MSTADRPTYFPNRQDPAPEVLDIFLHHIKLLVDTVVALEELNSDHFPILFTVRCSMTNRLIHGGCVIRWDEIHQRLKLIELPLDTFLSTDAFEIGIDTFTNTLRSAKIPGQVCRPHEAIKHFPNFSDIIAEKRPIRNRCKRHRNCVDKVELNRIATFVHHEIREFR